MAIKFNLISTSLCFPHPTRSHSPILCSHKGRPKWILLLVERGTTLLKYEYLSQQREDEVDPFSLGWKSQTLAEITSIEQGDLSYSSIRSLIIALENKAKKPCLNQTSVGNWVHSPWGFGQAIASRTACSGPEKRRDCSWLWASFCSQLHWYKSRVILQTSVE